MKGDHSRSSVDVRPDAPRYESVRLQQGRVLLDAEFNEQVEIDQRRREATLVDVLGVSAAPDTDGGFSVWGVLNALRISQGRFYADGLQIETRSECAYTDQPDYHPPAPGEPAAGENLLAYVEAWEELMTVRDDPNLLEPALGGVDTAARTRVVWQVKIVPFPAGSTSLEQVLADPAWAAISTQSTPATLAATLDAVTADADPCLGVASGGYRGIENQLYRVEVHRSGQPDTAQFKWSRQNGSVVATWSSPTGTGASWTVTVDSVGPDTERGFQEGDVVELTSAWHTEQGAPGVMARIETIDGTTVGLVEVSGGLGDAAFTGIYLEDSTTGRPSTLRMRRWEDPDGGSGVFNVADFATATELESGILIALSQDSSATGRPPYERGQYWLLPARTATSSVLGFTGGVAQPPRGPTRHFAPLRLYSAGNWIELRGVFLTLPELSPPPETSCCVYFVDAESGSGQLGFPGQVLMMPLTVRVTEGGRYAQTGTLTLQIVDGGVVDSTRDGQLSTNGPAGPFSAGPVTVTLTPAAEGRVSVYWKLDSDKLRRIQVVKASFTGPGNNGTGAPPSCEFTATLHPATETWFGSKSVAKELTLGAPIDTSPKPNAGPFATSAARASGPTVSRIELVVYTTRVDLKFSDLDNISAWTVGSHFQDPATLIVAPYVVAASAIPIDGSVTVSTLSTVAAEPVGSVLGFTIRWTKTGEILANGEYVLTLHVPSSGGHDPFDRLLRFRIGDRVIGIPNRP